MMKRTKMTLAAGVAALALAGIGGGVAFASGDSTPGTPSAGTVNATVAASTTPAAHPRKARGLWSRVEHGEATVHTKKGDETVDAQRGQVTAVGATSVTVRSTDGFTATYAVGGTSKIRADKQGSTIANVHTGDRVSVIAVRSGNTATVRRLADVGAAKK